MSVHYEGEVVQHLQKTINEGARGTLLDMMQANSESEIVNEHKRARLVKDDTTLPTVQQLEKVPSPKTSMGEKFDRLAAINQKLRSRQDKLSEIKQCAEKLDADLQEREKEEEGNDETLKNLNILRERIKSKTAAEVAQLEATIRQEAAIRRKLEISYWNDFYGPSETTVVEKVQPRERPAAVQKPAAISNVTTTTTTASSSSSTTTTMDNVGSMSQGRSRAESSTETSSQHSVSSTATRSNPLKPEELLLAAHGGKKDTMKALEEALCDVQYRNPLETPPCNCRKSKCLKLYCDCFALGLYCKDCRCVDCLNTSEAEPRRAHAVTAVLNRRPNAIRCKKLIKNPETEGPKTELSIKGCHCKKTRCLKKYCVCFHGGIKCGPHCVCVGCLNQDKRDDLPELPSAEAELSNVLASMSKG